jgi:spermidine synthase
MEPATGVVDAFLGGNPPWQLFTREAFALYRNHLRQCGAVVLNLIGSHLDPAQRPAMAAVAATAEAEFAHVEVYPDPWVEDDYPTRNLFIAAAEHPRVRPKALGRPSTAKTLDQALARSRALAGASEGGRILSDDAAPLGPLTRRTSEILRSRTLEYLPMDVLFF